jgi:hypothetical protein
VRPPRTRDHAPLPETTVGHQGRPGARRAAIPDPRRAPGPDDELTAVGIDPTDGRLYRALLGRPRASAEVLAEETGVGVDRARQGLAALERNGLVSRPRVSPAASYPPGLTWPWAR